MVPRAQRDWKGLRMPHSRGDDGASPQGWPTMLSGPMSDTMEPPEVRASQSHSFPPGEACTPGAEKAQSLEMW